MQIKSSFEFGNAKIKDWEIIILVLFLTLLAVSKKLFPLTFCEKICTLTHWKATETKEFFPKKVAFSKKRTAQKSQRGGHKSRELLFLANCICFVTLRSDFKHRFEDVYIKFLLRNGGKVIKSGG